MTVSPTATRATPIAAAAAAAAAAAVRCEDDGREPRAQHPLAHPDAVRETVHHPTGLRRVVQDLQTSSTAVKSGEKAMKGSAATAEPR